MTDELKPCEPTRKTCELHTTHFDDCGCLSARLEAKVKELEEKKKQDREYIDRVTEKLLDRDLKNIELARKFEEAVEVHIKHRFLCQTFHRDEEEKMTMKDLEKEFLKEIEERMKNEHSEN